MMRGWSLFWKIVLAASVAIAGFVWYAIEGRQITEIRFDLGKPIHDTARHSGVPSYAVDNTAGLIEYSVAGLEPDVKAVFTRGGAGITWGPLFSFTLNADHDRTPDDIVEDVALQLDSHYLHNAGEMLAFVKATVAQFSKGPWQRFIPSYCPRVKGRSSILDEHGTLEGFVGCPVDPAYEIPEADLDLVMPRSSKHWMWRGDGVIADLEIGNYPIDGKNVYTGWLTFELESTYQADQVLIDENSKISAAELAAQAVLRKAEIEEMEAAAAARGEKL